jgi:hypothetical protein
MLLLASLGVVCSIACDDDSSQPSSPESDAWIVLASEHPFPAFEVNEMWGAATDDVHAVSGYGQILHFDGTKWSVGQAPGGIYFNDVWGTARDDIFAVGFGGGVVHFDGQQWRSQYSGTDLGLFGVWGCAPDTVYAVGLSGTVLRFDGSSWNKLTPPTTADP